MAEKPDPVVGMSVTWINTRGDRFVEYSLIGKIGQEGLTVRSVETPREGYILVTLNKNGEVVMDLWDPSWGPAPENSKPQISSFSWEYLEPR